MHGLPNLKYRVVCLVQYAKSFWMDKERKHTWVNFISKVL